MKALTASILAITLMGGAASAQTAPSPSEVRAIAKEAYIYGFPMVDSYRVNHAYFVDRAGPEFKAPWNTINNTARVYTPDDKAIQTPNSDTPYSQLGMDLRAEPLVLTLPKIEDGRYISVQLIDAYTFNFAYLGSRTTGPNGGHFLIAGPRWQGSKPPGVTEVIRSETEFAWGLYRTQLLGPADIEKVKAIQAGYRVQTLSSFLGQPAPTPQPAVAFIPPLSPEDQRSSLEFFNILNFVLQAAPVHPSEADLRARFARIGVEAGKPFRPGELSPETQQALKAGMADAWAEFAAFKTRDIDTGKVKSGDLFGTREYLRNNYLYRMAGAILGIYGNSKEEALYPVYLVDSQGEKLDGASKTYTLKLGPQDMPPANAFWSLTLYELPSSLLHANRLNRYLINSPMLPDLKRDPDGGFTLHIQHDSPGGERESNWLPAPSGPFWVIMRIYWPKPEALDGSWKQPPLVSQARAAQPAVPAPVKVTPATYIRAETDRSFGNIQHLAGGINRFMHIRAPTPLDKQTVIRMNRDTLYSAAILDTAKGSTVTLPVVPAGRFMSLLIVDNDHYAPAVFYGAGPHRIPSDTRYVMAAIRIQLFDPKDPQEVALVNRLQDQIVVDSPSSEPLPPFQWDLASLEALTAAYNKEAASVTSFKGMMGPRGTVNEATRHLAAAAGWGLNPDKDATYLNYSGVHDPARCYRGTYRVPENDAFWSITVYGSDGFMKSDNNIVNSSNVRLDPDGTFSVYFGPAALCGDVPNRVDVTPGWNFTMRIYRPGPSVLSGAYSMPAPEPLR